MKTLAVVLLSVIVVGCVCNPNQELVNGVKNMMQNSPNADSLAGGCENIRYFWNHNTNRAGVDNLGNVAQTIRWLKGNHVRQFGKALKDLKFGRKTISLSFENHISGSRSGVIAKALIGHRNGDSVSASIAVATSTCDMKQQYNYHTYRKCKKILFWKKCHTVTDKHPRGLNPGELNHVLVKLQGDASRELYNNVVHHTGLRASEFDFSLQSLYVQESQVLRRFYPELVYDYTELSDVPQNEISPAVREASQGQISDGHVLNRMSQVAGSAGRSSFFHSPNNNLLFVISINRSGANFLIRMSSFTVNGRLPGGAFATSVGGWNLERPGHPVNPSSHELIKIFPALK